MGWLSSLFGGNEMDELERVIRDAPAPSAFLRLAHLHMEQGNASKALEVARKGMERFDSADLRACLVDAERVSHLAEADQIKTKIERFPNPTLYARLATIYLEQGDLDACTRTCAIAVKAFPDYAGIYLVMAQVSRKQHMQDKVIHYLEKATEMDAYNYAAHMMLAEELVALQQKGEARERLHMILRFAPDDERVMQLLSDLEADMSSAASPAADSEQASGLSSNEQKTEAHKSEEPTRHLKLSSPDETEVEKNKTIEGIMKPITSLEGVEAGLLVDRSGLIVACRSIPKNFDEELAAAVVSNVCRAVEQSAGDLGIGDFLEASVEGDAVTLQIMPVNDMVLAAFATPAVRAGRLQRAMHGCVQELAAS